MREDEGRCYWSLAGDGSLLTAPWEDLSGDEPARRARRLEQVSAVARLLDAMGATLEAGHEKIQQDRRVREQAERSALEQLVEDGRARVAEYEQQAAAAAEDLRRKATEAAREGQAGQAEIYRTLAGTPEIGPGIVRDSQEVTEAWAGVASQLQGLSSQVDDLLARVHDARKKGRDTRLRARWVNPLVIGLFGVGVGVIATQLLQDQAEDLGAVVPWVVAVVAWALLDYRFEPRLRRRLANRQLENMREEVRLAFAAWRHLREMEVRLGQERLPAWSKMRELTAALPPVGAS